MKNNWHGNRIWQIGYPIAVYYIFYNFLYALLLYIFKEQAPRLLLLGIASFVTGIVLFLMYQRLPIVKAEKWWDNKTIGKELCAVLIIVLLGIALNVLITNTPLIEWSKGFTTSTEVLGDGGLAMKLVVTGILIPVMEELLYRGIVAGQLKLWSSTWVAVLVSALLFGVFHFNLVQFLYAFLMGMALSFLYVKTSKLWLCIFAHGMTNMVVILYPLIVS